MKKIIFLFVVGFLLFNWWPKIVLAEIPPQVRVSLSAHSPRLVLLRPSSRDQVVATWRLTNLSNERLVVNNLWVRARGRLNQISHLNFNILEDNELQVDYDEYQGGPTMFFRDIYVVLAPHQSKEISLVVTADHQITWGDLFWFSLRAEDLDGFSTSSNVIRAVGNFPINSSLITTLGRR